MNVRAKKHLGQHFLTDKNTCRKIANQFGLHRNCRKVLEVGPGMGALTNFLLERDLEVWVMEVDSESVAYLKEHFPMLEDKIIQADFLRSDLKKYFGEEPFAVVGNFPYNISTQILFKCLEYKDQVPEIMGMFQKEVAERVAKKPGSREYGILSVLMQAFYEVEYCFTVDEHVFSPPPKVKSGIIRCERNDRDKLPCNEKLFIQVVKATFNQRRKTVRNGIRALMQGSTIDSPLLGMRPEQLGVEEFIELTQLIEQTRHPE